MPSIQVIGGAQLDRKLIEIAKTMRRRETRAAFRRGAAVVREAVRGETPQDKGKLRQSVISFGSKRTGAAAEPAAFARVNILKGRVRAPHGHLVHFGTQIRRPKRGKVLVFEGELGRGLGARGKRLTGLVFTRRAASLKPNPFFERGVVKSQNQAVTNVVTDLKNIIERTAAGKPPQ